MRYVGQGHEITVELPVRELAAEDAGWFKQAFDAAYEATFGRIIPSMEVEILTWAVTVSSEVEPPASAGQPDGGAKVESVGRRSLFDSDRTDYEDVPVYERAALSPGATIPGPALITEAQTTTVVSRNFDARLNSLGYIDMRRKIAPSQESRP